MFPNRHFPFSMSPNRRCCFFLCWMMVRPNHRHCSTWLCLMNPSRRRSSVCLLLVLAWLQAKNTQFFRGIRNLIKNVFTAKKIALKNEEYLQFPNRRQTFLLVSWNWDPNDGDSSLEILFGSFFLFRYFSIWRKELRTAKCLKTFSLVFFVLLFYVCARERDERTKKKEMKTNMFAGKDLISKKAR